MIMVDKTSDEGKAAIERHLRKNAPGSRVYTNSYIPPMYRLPEISEEKEGTTSPTDAVRSDNAEPVESRHTAVGHSGEGSDEGSPSLVIGELRNSDADD